MGEIGKFKTVNGNTDKGYTEKMRRNIIGMEQKIRNNKDESLHIFSSKGDLLLSFQGKGNRVTTPIGTKFPENAIWTHNHPKSLGETGIKRIGNSFSHIDIESAVKHNAKEARAVTPTYTFSIKRPKNGWGATSSEVARVFKRYEKMTKSEFTDYVSKRNYSPAAVRRAEVMHFHRVNQLVAKHFGWNYTKKNK